MPNLYDPEQVERLIESNEKLGGHVVELRSELKFVKYVMYVLAVCVVVSGMALYSSWSTARDRQHERSEQLISACKQFNAQRFEVREANKSLGAVVTSPTPSQLAALEVLNTTVDARLPYRDCTPEGIRTYFENPPVDPATVPTTTR